MVPLLLPLLANGPLCLLEHVVVELEEIALAPVLSLALRSLSILRLWLRMFPTLLSRTCILRSLGVTLSAVMVLQLRLGSPLQIRLETTLLHLYLLFDLLLLGPHVHLIEASLHGVFIECL